MGVLWHGAISTKNVGILHRQKSLGQSSFVRCGKEKQAGVQGNWQKESVFKQELEIAKRDLSFNGLLMRRAYHAGM